MTKTPMKAVVFEEFGEPADVLQCRDVPVSEPGPGEVRVRMLASPINPSDLMTVRGIYGKKPELPATPGYEGVGVVEASGGGMMGKFLTGKRVAVPNRRTGNWCEHTVIPAKQAIPVSSKLPLEQVAMFFVNPATVLAMIRHELAVPKGAWLLQSAANSELGQMIIRLGQHDGFRTVNVVRRPEAAEELRKLGADVVIATTDGPISEQVRRAIGQEDGVSYAVDAVGGDIGTGLFESLAPQGTMLAYGTLSGEPIRVNPRLMIAGRRELRGFWLGHWMRSRSKLAALPLFVQIAKLIRRGVLATRVGASFPLSEIRRAARQTGKSFVAPARVRWIR